MTVVRYFVFGVSSLSFLLVSISGTTVSVAFPAITDHFHTSLIIAGWVLSINQLTATAIMPLAGKAGDIFGTRRAFLASIAVFTLGSLLAAVAPNIWLLIAARFVQAVGMGSFLPLGTAIVSDYFAEARQQAIGLFTSIMPIGMIIGPNLGGWLVEAFGWRSVFWLNIPLGVAVFTASFFLLRGKEGREKGHLDLTGAGLFTGSLSAFLIALTQLGHSRTGLSWTVSGLLLVLAVVAGYFFLKHERETEDPVIDLMVLKERPFLAANIFNLVYGISVLGVMAFIPLYATSVYGMSTLGSGLILTPRSIGTIVASTVTSLFLPKLGYRHPMLLGTGITVLTLVLLGLRLEGLEVLGLHLSGTVILVVIIFLSGIGMGITAPAANNACIELMPQRVATITGVRGMFRQSGSAISTAVITLVLQNWRGMGGG
ncbi:MAG: MFS transporter, partial [Dehalococcoidales bacterium]|nr:MFS transporter [Dehalococcoidales bacterium]